MRAPSTTRGDDALSATVSAMRMRQSAMRLSTTSMAGSAPAIAASACAAVTPGAGQLGAPSRTAISASTRG